MNFITFDGNLGRDAEVKTFDNGTKAMRFTVAVKPNWRGKTDQERPANWIPVTVWGKLVEFLEGKLTKGTPVCVSGEMTTRMYEKDGQKRSAFEVRAESVRVCASNFGTQKADQDSFGEEAGF